MAGLTKLLVIAGVVAAAATNSPAPDPTEAMAQDDECAAEDEACAFNALQLRGALNVDDPAEVEGSAASAPDVGEGAGEGLEAAPAPDVGEEEDAPLVAEVGYGGWYAGGDKVWGSGAGVENVNSGNVGYYNSGFSAARGHCADSGCALIVNPPGHRTVNKFHIHFVRYHGYGSSLKSRLSSATCRSSGWHGGFPCGGKAKFFSGWPGVFSAAMSGGSIHSASVIAWPSSCGGRGTIVQIAYGCSIEHQIRGDYNPAKR